MLLDHHQTLLLLKKYRIPFAESQSFKDISEVKLQKYPLALKIDSPEVIHKSELGLVETGIRNVHELASSIGRFNTIVGMHAIRKYSYVVQTMVQGKEIIIGMKRDSTFGPVILLGIGGIFVEVLKDVSMRVAPLSRKDCFEMIEELRSKKLLEGYRGSPPVNKTAIVEMLLSMSKLSIENHEIMEIDLNPVMANEKNTLVVDARFINA
jgi:acetate---CoA ligase (ADP-forming) subunit beta